jgi:hypothetical protein
VDVGMWPPRIGRRSVIAWLALRLPIVVGEVVL